MNFDPVLVWLESTALSQWVVGSPSLFAFPGILALHAIGMGVAAGLAGAFDLRILGVARQVPMSEMRRYLPVLWFGFWLNLTSGLLLLVAYPTKALTNPVFYLKITLIAVAMFVLTRQVRLLGGGSPTIDVPAPVSSRRPKRLAILSLVCWAGAITAGRFLAYTYTRLTAIE
jgi:hypothetical protein